ALATARCPTWTGSKLPPYMATFIAIRILDQMKTRTENSVRASYVARTTSSWRSSWQPSWWLSSRASLRLSLQLSLQPWLFSLFDLVFFYSLPYYARPLERRLLQTVGLPRPLRQL